MEKERELLPVSAFQKDFYAVERTNKKLVKKKHCLILGHGYFDHGAFDADAMEKAYFEVLRRNDAFRIRFVKRIGLPKQYFQDVSEFPIPKRIALDGGFELFKELCEKPVYPDIMMFDKQLTKAIIYSCNDGTGGIIIWQHHICSDGYSMGKLAYKQLCDFYDCYKNGEVPQEPKKLYSLADFIKWERNDIKKNFSEHFKWNWKEVNRHFWKYAEPRLNGKTEGTYKLVVDGERLEAAERICSENLCSDTSIVMAMMAILAHTKFRNKKISFISESYGRMNFAQRNTCGALLVEVNVFYEVEDSDKLIDVVNHSAQKLMEAYRHQRFSEVFSRVFFCPMIALRNFGVNLNWMTLNNLRDYHSNDEYSLEIMGIEQASVYYGVEAKILNADEGQGFYIEIGYDYLSLTEEEIGKMERQLEGIFDAICNNPSMTVGDCIKSIS